MKNSNDTIAVPEPNAPLRAPDIHIIPGVFTVTLLLYRHIPLHRDDEFPARPDTADPGRGMLMSARNRPPPRLSVGAAMPPHGWRQGGGVGSGIGDVTSWRRSKEIMCCSILSRIAHSQASRFSGNGDWQVAGYQVDLVKVRQAFRSFRCIAILNRSRLSVIPCTCSASRCGVLNPAEQIRDMRKTATLQLFPFKFLWIRFSVIF